MNYKNIIIPKEISKVTQVIEEAGFEAYLVGGCVRDLFLGQKAKDWDVTTNATPEEIQALFPHTFYENKFGTVGIVNEEEGIDETLKVVEATPYRIEGIYSNNRHPDEVSFSTNLSDDLKRRDFTINAIAVREKKEGIEVVDLFDGKTDLKLKLIKTVGDPHLRFNEDGLRIMRAIRLAVQLDFEIDEVTEKAIFECGSLLQNISAERLRDEFSKMLNTSDPMRAILMLKKLNLLQYIIPELEEGVGCTQNKAHSFDVFEHLLRSLKHAADKNYPFEIRLSALLHDIGKPATRRFSEEKKEYTFYGHEVVGARMTKKILDRLKFPKDTIDKVTKLVRWHMFFSDTEQITLSAVRRMIVNVGKENIWDLMDVRICDRIGTGRPKEAPFRLRKYHSMIEEALRDPVSVGQLKVNGTILMEKLAVPPSPALGFILHALLEEVLEEPEKNTEEYLLERSKELLKLPLTQLKELGLKGKAKKEKADEEEVQKIRKNHNVK